MSNKLAQAIAEDLWFVLGKILPKHGVKKHLLEKQIEEVMDNMPGEVFTPLVKGRMPHIWPKEIERMAEIHRKVSGDTQEDAVAAIKFTLKDEVWLNDIYQVNVRRTPEIVHLSIKRRDKAPITDWRHKQLIKNQLVGESCEGIELYPAKDRLVDSANQYHLWVYADPTLRIPIGFKQRMTNNASTGGAKQRKL